MIIHQEEPEVSNILGVFGLSLRTREADLEDVFHEFGTIEKVTIVYDHRVNNNGSFMERSSTSNFLNRPTDLEALALYTLRIKLMPLVLAMH